MRPSTSTRQVAAGGRLSTGVEVGAPGLRFLVPGWAQLAWGQTDRAAAHGGSFFAALSTAVFCWGTSLGWWLLGVAVLWQVVSLLDVLRQRAYPTFPLRIAFTAAALALSLLVYLPAGGLLWLYAWPTHVDGSTGAGYLVNRLAYRHASPQIGQWVWVEHVPSHMPCTGQILAVAGQEIECTGRGWRVNGRKLPLPFPGPATDYPDGWRFRVPEAHVLVGPDSLRARGRVPSPLLIVAYDQILGHAWARVSPLWDRALL